MVVRRLVSSAVNVRLYGGPLMGARKTPNLPARLEGARRRFELWRRTRKGRSRIPEMLWASAVKAAGKYGVNKTAQALRLDYYVLKKRVEAAENHVEAAGSRRVSGGKVASHLISDREVVSADGPLTAIAPVKGRQAVATFVELASPVSASTRECILELEDPGGAKMRVHLKGVDAPDLAALSRSFWGIETCHGERRHGGGLSRRTGRRRT
jgi:hypothetical protein